MPASHLDLNAFPILVVDDEPMNLAVFEFNFVPEFRLRLAGSAEEALRILDAEPIAVIIADHRMPGMLGLDLLSVVKERTPTVVRMLLTAHGDVPLLHDAVNRGTLFRYVAKPWDAHVLRQDMILAVERHLAQVRAQTFAGSASGWSPVAVGAALTAAVDAGNTPAEVVDAARRWTRGALAGRVPVPVAWILEEARLRAGGAPGAIRLEVDAELPHLSVAVAPLVEALLALVDNARAAASHGVVVAAGRTHNDTVRITVRDDGPGVPALHVAGGLRPFAEGGTGAGLGLAVARGVVAALGGRVVVEGGAPGVVHIDLPIEVPSGVAP